MKHFKFFLFLLISILCLSSCNNYNPDIQEVNAATQTESTTVKESIKKYNLDINSLRITNTQNPDFNFITTYSMAEDNSYYSLNISYPHFQNEELNTKTTDILNKYLDNYTKTINSEILEEKSFFYFRYTALQTYNFLTVKFYTQIQTENFSYYEDDFTIDLEKYFPNYELPKEKETIKLEIEEPSQVNPIKNSNTQATQKTTEASSESIKSTEKTELSTSAANIKSTEKTELSTSDESTKSTERVIKNSSKMLALTFDDGPDASNTPILLDALKERNVKATFFLVGYNIEKNPEIVKRIYNEGHCIGNHTYDHLKLTTIDSASAKAQYTKVEDLLKSIIGQGSDFFRPPYGSYNNTVISFANTPIALWNVDPLDWQSRNTNTVYNHIIDNAVDGNIILLHDLYPTSVEAAIKAIDELSEDGYQFVTVEELMKRNGTTPKNGTILYNVPYNK